MTFIDHCFSVVPCLLDVSVPGIDTETDKKGTAIIYGLLSTLHFPIKTYAEMILSSIHTHF